MNSTNAIEVITVDEAINRAPAVGATSPSDKVSNNYQFISTKEILNRVQKDGWLITNVSAQSRSPHAQHRITLVHEDHLDKARRHEGEGIPRIEMFNSHNLSKRLMFAIGYFKFVCSNGLIVASGPAETIRTKHRFSGNKLEQIMEQVSDISSRFPAINDTIERFKSRELTDLEQRAFAEYAIKGRYNYRPSMPKRFHDMGRNTERLLTYRREEDSGNSTWQVFNRVQENIMLGINGFSRPLRGYSDSIRMNQLLWKGAETTLGFDSSGLTKALNNLLIKDRKKGKISV